MRFANFEFESPFGSVVLDGLGHQWDLHNFANLVAAQASPDTQTAYLEWRVEDGVPNPWGSPGNTFAGCRIAFSGVRSFRMRGAVSKPGDINSYTVSRIGKTVPGEDEYPFKFQWGVGEPFCLRIETESSGVIDVDAELAVLEPIARLDV